MRRFAFGEADPYTPQRRAARRAQLAAGRGSRLAVGIGFVAPKSPLSPRFVSVWHVYSRRVFPGRLWPVGPPTRQSLAPGMVPVPWGPSFSCCGGRAAAGQSQSHCAAGYNRSSSWSRRSINRPDNWDLQIFHHWIKEIKIRGNGFLFLW